MWHKYKNGNSVTRINDTNGTKIRFTKDDEFHVEFPESMDISIGRRCDGGCKYCYERATPDGPEADLMNVPFLDSLRPYTEIAINGNSVDHSQLIPLLEKLKEKNVFVNMTVNQMHFERKEDVITDLIERKLIYGLGISLVHASGDFISRAQQYPNAVIHTICGVTSIKDYISLVDRNLKVLILGYKDKGRGHDYLSQNEGNVKYLQNWLEKNVKLMIDYGWYKVISFDNLALEQLKLKEKLSPEKWEEFYQGEEGSLTMYIDLVDQTFGRSSLEPKENMIPLMDDVVKMFDMIRSDR